MENNSGKPIFRLLLIVIILVIIGAAGYMFYLKMRATNNSPKTTPTARNVQEVTPTDTANYNGAYGCVFIPKLCKQGKVISANITPTDTFYGIGFTDIPKGTEIKAAISGKIGIGVSTDPKTGVKANILSVTNDSSHLEASYRFIGTIPSIDPTAGLRIKRGQTIGFVGDKTITFRQETTEYSLLFSVIDLSAKKFIKLDPSDLK